MSIFVDKACVFASLLLVNICADNVKSATDSLPVNLSRVPPKEKNEYHHLCSRLCSSRWLRAEAAWLVLSQTNRPYCSSQSEQAIHRRCSRCSFKLTEPLEHLVIWMPKNHKESTHEFIEVLSRKSTFRRMSPLL